MAQKCEGELSMSVGLDDGDLFKWRICFQGPENTPFEGGLFEATLKFPEEFPYQPPKMIFKTEMFHPNSNPTPIQSTPPEKSASPFYIPQYRTPSILNRNSQKNGILS